MLTTEPEVDAQAELLAERARHLIPSLREGMRSLDASNAFPAASFEHLREAGLLGAATSPRHGGAGLAVDGRLDRLAALVYEIARGCTTTAQLYAIHLAGTLIVDGVASEQQRDALLPVKAGATFTAWGSEPSRWLLPGDPSTLVFDTALSPTPGGFLLNGTKYFASGADSFNHYLVWVRSANPDEGDGSRPVVVCVSATSDGVTIEQDWDAMGQRGTRSDRATFTDCFVPNDMVLAREGAWDPLVGGETFQILLAAIYLGSAHGALDYGREYLLNHARPQPPYERASEDPVKTWHLGRLVAGLAAARALLMRVGRLTRGLGDEHQRADVVAQISAAKAVATTAALEAVIEVFRVCGPSVTRRVHHVPELMLRNVRTLTLHDPVDRRLTALGIDFLERQDGRVIVGAPKE